MHLHASVYIHVCDNQFMHTYILLNRGIHVHYIITIIMSTLLGPTGDIKFIMIKVIKLFKYTLTKMRNNHNNDRVILKYNNAFAYQMKINAA